jgi:hypothetical protein
VDDFSTERLESGDGEREALMTRKMPYEPLPASVRPWLFVMGRHISEQLSVPISKRSEYQMTNRSGCWKISIDWSTLFHVCDYPKTCCVAKINALVSVAVRKVLEISNRIRYQTIPVAQHSENFSCHGTKLVRAIIRENE